MRQLRQAPSAARQDDVVDAAEARARLGVEPGTPWREVKATYRRLIRAHHPDVGGNGPEAGERTAAITQAYAVLRAARAVDADAGAEPPPAEPVPDPPGYRVVDGGTLALAVPADEAFFALLEVAHEVGEVTYVDPDAGLLETVVHLEGGPACSLVVTLQGRGDGTTEAFCTLEPLGKGPSPAATAAVEVLGHRLSATGWRRLSDGGRR